MVNELGQHPHLSSTTHSHFGCSLHLVWVVMAPKDVRAARKHKGGGNGAVARASAEKHKARQAGKVAKERKKDKSATKKRTSKGDKDCCIFLGGRASSPKRYCLCAMPALF